MASGKARTRCCGNVGLGGSGDAEGGRALAKEGFTLAGAEDKRMKEWRGLEG